MKKKIKITDFTKKEEDIYQKDNKLIKIFGLAGTGKTTFISNLIKDKIINEKNKNILILSYTHTGKNEFVRKLLNEDLGRFNYTSLKYGFFEQIEKPVPDLLKETGSDVGAMTIYSFIYRHLKNLEHLEGFEYISENLKSLISNNTYYIKSSDFKNFVVKNKLNIDVVKLINILEIIKDREENPLTVKKIEKMIKEKKLVFTEDEILFTILFLENNIYQHEKTIVYDYINNKKYWLLELIKNKWESLFDIELDIQKLFEYKELVIEEFPLFNLNSYLVYLSDVINKNYILDKLVSSYNYVIVDEAQDTPDFLLDYVFKLIDTDYLYLVGDPAQNIYFDLGYSELFTKYEKGKNILVLDKVYRYSEKLLNLLRNKYPKFKLIYQVESVSDYDTQIIYLDNKQKIIHLVGGPGVVLIKNTNKKIKLDGFKVYPLFVNINKAIPLFFNIILDYDFYISKSLNPSLLNKWVRKIITKYPYYIYKYISEKNDIKDENLEERLKYAINVTIDKLKNKDIKVSEALSYLRDTLIDIGLVKKTKIKDTSFFYYVLFSNTYQSKGKSFDKVVYYNEFGKYFLMKKEREDNLYWNFYHSTLEYVGYTRARKLLIIVD